MNSLYLLLCVAHSLACSSSGIDVRRILANEARQGLRNLLVHCSVTSQSLFILRER